MGTPATYSNLKHAIGLKKGAGTNYGFAIQRGSYRKGVQERYNARVSVGPNRWLADNKVSQWAQEDFSGGAFQERWGEDTAMFKECSLMVPAPDRKALKTLPTLRHCEDDGADLINTTNYTGVSPWKDYCTGNGIVFVLGDDDYVYMFKPVGSPIGATSYDGVVDASSASVVRSTHEATCISYNSILDKLSVGYDDGRVNEYTVTKTPTSVSLTLWRIFTYETTAHGDIDSAHKYISDITVFYGYVIVAMYDLIMYYSAWDSTTSGSSSHSATPAWTKLGNASGDDTKGFCESGGTLIIMSGSSYDTWLDSATLAGGVLPWMKVPYVFGGQSLCEYGGRVYINGWTSDGVYGALTASLYELSGSSFREVHTWRVDDQNVDGDIETYYTWSLATWDGLLYMDLNGKLVAYDFITDALFGAYEQSTADGHNVKGIVPLGINLYCLATGTSTTNGLYVVPRENIQDHDSYVILSEFNLEPALKKNWSECFVQTKFGGCDLWVSTNDGETWTQCTRTSEVVAEYTYDSVFDLSAITASKRILIKVVMEDDDDFQVASVETGVYLYYNKDLVNTVVSFVLEPPQLNMWTVAVAAVDNVENLDGTTDSTTDPADVISQLWTWYKAGDLLTLTDRDATTSKVVITQIQEVEPDMVGGNPPDREAFVTITLAETTAS